jgi:hypothetical protein
LQVYIKAGISLDGIDWSEFATLFALPVVRYPIELFAHRFLGPGTIDSIAGFVSSFQQNSDLKRLVETGKLVII